MRVTVALIVAAATLAVPASAANVAPIDLVLRQIEVPPRYELDEDNSFAIPNAYLAAKPEGRRIVARTGRLGGYYARYTNYGSTGSPHWRYVNSAADVFRRPDGAMVYFAWFDRNIRQELTGPVKRTSVNIGTTARLYSSPSPDVGTVVIWRHSRVVAWLMCEEMTTHRQLAIALARKQQQRIAAALR